MAGRPEKHPGVFKAVPNFAGMTEFVHPDHVRGTVRAGWDLVGELSDPFHRALMTMFVITECHP